jgi:3-oxoacyl-[acyl-carrier protein] reductase
MAAGQGPLAGRTALVTGGNRGIGRAISLALAEAGADIAIAYRTRTPEAIETRAKVQRLGRRAATIQTDVSVGAEAIQLVERARRELGEIDILVNNAGEIRPQAVELITEQDWHDLISVNLTSAFLITQAVLPTMRRRRWGRIIMLSSVAAQLGGVVGPHYAAAKAGVIGLVHSYATLLAKEGITANAIAPALIHTDMVTNNPRATAALIPVGRFGEVNEVASVAVMLATNAYITGQTISVNGGWYMTS